MRLIYVAPICGASALRLVGDLGHVTDTNANRPARGARQPAPVRRRRQADVPKPAPFGPAARSRHYRRAQVDRGGETRARLIEAGLDVFGQLWLEGATK